MRKPSVTLSCPANAHSSPNERIVEFSFPDLRDSAGCPVGGLISLRTLNDGTPLVDVYRTDGAIRVLAPKEQPGPKPPPSFEGTQAEFDAQVALSNQIIDEVIADEKKPRRYLAVKLDAGNDRNGNPRRGWLVYLDAPESPILGWIEEGYSGEFALYDGVLWNEAGAPKGAKPSTTQAMRELRDSGRVRVLCSLKVPYSEIREARRTPFKLPAA